MGVPEPGAKALWLAELAGRDSRAMSLEDVTAVVDAVIKKFRTYDAAMAALEAEPATA
jgi:hypothetical protein